MDQSNAEALPAVKSKQMKYECRTPGYDSYQPTIEQAA
jgi:hypothetical protein